MFDYPTIYDIIYALAAKDGRVDALFGNYAGLAHEAFARSYAGEAFPEIWFELPLAGEPWFDLHVLTARETLDAGMVFEPEHTAGHPELFEWFASAPGVRQLAISYDLRSGNIDDPAVQLLVRDTAMHEPFLELAGGAAAAGAFRAFAQRLPEAWFPCYTGIFPGRPGAAVRVECIPTRELQQAYAQDEDLLAAHLRQTGLAHIDESIVPRCHKLAQEPFQLEFQFDVLPNGAPGDTFGASARFAAPGDEDGWEPFGIDGAAGEFMAQVEAWGLADERWRLLADTAYAKRAARGGQSTVISCYPAFVKFRWRAGQPLDAKTYLVAGMQQERA